MRKLKQGTEHVAGCAGGGRAVPDRSALSTVVVTASSVAGLLIIVFAMTGCGRGVRAHANIATATAAPVEPWYVDADGNGFPDSVELHSFEDRENFRRWFTAIAERQFYQVSNTWNPEQRDCAGLVRFSMREALKRHDHAWFQRMGPQYQQVARDVKAYTLESGRLGEKLFRTDYGAFKTSDLENGKFSDYADGRTLKNYNSSFVSRDRGEARPGDLLLFYQPWVQKYPYHVMIFLGQAQIDNDGAADWVVYHTGSSAKDAGTVKKVRMAVLDHHPDK